MNTIKSFVREFWLWMFVPAFVVTFGLLALVAATEDGGATPFIYNIF